MNSIFAPAKINLFLDVLGRRPDGYHDLHTAFCAVDLCDELTIEFVGRREDSGWLAIRQFTVEGPFANGTPADARNLVWRALDQALLIVKQQNARFWDRFYPRFDLRLVKNIPHGAGLGGGSSDAAAALLLFRRIVRQLLTEGGLPDLDLDPKELRRVATALGSDVPFFLKGGMAEATGRGELLGPLPTRELILLIVKPAFSISTVDAYRALRPEMLGPASDAYGLRRWLGRETEEFPVLNNTFERALDPVYPELRTIREAMMEHGALLARLSGSGSASFGLFPDTASRDQAHEALRGSHACFPCRSLGPVG